MNFRLIRGEKGRSEGILEKNKMGEKNIESNDSRTLSIYFCVVFCLVEIIKYA